MSTFLSVRRFGIVYGMRGDSKPHEYIVPFNTETGATAKEPVAALHEFHKYMQRARCLPAESYVVREIFSVHQDMGKNDVRMTYDLPGGPNPVIKEPKKREPAAPSEMFNDDEIRKESIHARAQFSR